MFDQLPGEPSSCSPESLTWSRSTHLVANEGFVEVFARRQSLQRNKKQLFVGAFKPKVGQPMELHQEGAHDSTSWGETASPRLRIAPHASAGRIPFQRAQAIERLGNIPTRGCLIIGMTKCFRFRYSNYAIIFRGSRTALKRSPRSVGRLARN